VNVAVVFNIFVPQKASVVIVLKPKHRVSAMVKVFLNFRKLYDEDDVFYAGSFIEGKLWVINLFIDGPNDV
jgi:hypothetical protein